MNRLTKAVILISAVWLWMVIMLTFSAYINMMVLSANQYTTRVSQDLHNVIAWLLSVP